MKAQVLYGINDLRYVDKDLPEIKEGHVIVKVMAAGICGSDIPRIFETGAHNMPLVPGHEFSGKVLTKEECRQLKIAEDNDFQDKWAGKRVGIFPLIPCGVCSCCKQEKYEMCRHYDYLGSRSDGGYAEYVAVPEWNLIELPDEVSYQAAAMLEPMAVSVHAIRQFIKSRADIEGKTIVICGLGTIGLMILYFLKDIAGCVDNIYVVGNKEFQKKNALRAGLKESHYIDEKKEDVVKWIHENISADGVDFYFECVGKNQTISQGINSVRPAGFLQLVGNPFSDMEFDRDTYWKILRNQLTIKGTWNSAFTKSDDDDWHYVLKALADRKIDPEIFISHRLELGQLRKGLDIMKDKTEEYIKVMVCEE